MRPEPGTYPSYFEKYISSVTEVSIIEALQQNLVHTKAILQSVPSEKETYAYAIDKWSVKQLVNHIIDTERIFAYRALRFARKDVQQPLAFDENLYALNAEVSTRTLSDLLEEFILVRQSTISLFHSFSNATMQRQGPTTLGNTTVLALGFMICGHATHHMKVLIEKYLLQVPLH